jgi:alpha-2-macroglobulin-like protein
VWRNDAKALAAIEARGKVAEGTLAREGFSHTPQVTSNLAAAQATGGSLARDARRAANFLRDAASFALLAVLLLLVGEGIAAVLRRAVKAPPVLQAFTGVAAAFGVLVGVMLLLNSQLGEALAPGARVAGEALEAKDFDGEGAAAVLAKPARLAMAAAHDDRWGDMGLRLQAIDPAANPLGGAFYNDGADADIRARTENFFAADLGEPIGFVEGAAKPAEPDQGEEAKNFRRGDDERYRQLMRAYLTQRRARQYAHQQTAHEGRTDFTPTIFWNTLVTTDERGEAKVAFATSDAVTTWLVQADAHTVTGRGRLGQARATFTTQQPLQVEAKLPVEVAAGDRLLLPIAATATFANATEVAITVTVADGISLAAAAPTTIALRDGKGRVLLPLTVADRIGTARLTIDARAGRFTDQVTQTIAIAPRGFPHRRSAGGSVEPGKPSTATIAIPADPVAGSGRVTLKVFPSPLAALTEGLQGILQEPHGCFEQASSSNYPNTLVLTLLEANGDDIPALAARARELLPKGYAKITSYECKQQGYEWFGGDPGHEALTAYGLLQFHDMAKVHSVDAAMLERTKQWLLARRDGNGGFARNGKALDRFGGAPEPVTNAYVTYALLQSGTPAASLPKEIDALLARATTDDPYELALIASVLHLAQRAPEAQRARRRLAELQKPDGSLHGTTSSITRSGGDDLLVESTGFAILAWLPDPTFAGQARKAIEFVQGRRSAQGTFGATQATITALRALTAYATANRSMRAPGTIRIFAGERRIAERAFAANDTGALAFELWPELTPGEHTLRVEVDGGSAGTALPWACDVSYHAAQPADDPAAAVAITTTLRSSEAREGDTVALDVRVQNRTANGQPMTMAIVGLPAGCELPTRVLEDLQKANAFAFWELRGRELALYWRDLAPEATHELTLDLVARVPGTTSGPASRTYLYYTPAAKRWAPPLALTIAPR